MKKRFIVAYDLHNASTSNYEKVSEAIKRCGDAVEVQLSVWLLSSSLTKDEISDTTRSAISDKDKLFIAEILGTYRQNAPIEVQEFLERNPL